VLLTLPVLKLVALIIDYSHEFFIFLDPPGDETPPPKRRRAPRRVVYDVEVRYLPAVDEMDEACVEWQFVAATYLPRSLDMQELLVALEDYADFLGVPLRVARQPFVPSTQLLTNTGLPSGSTLRMNLGH